MSTHMIGTSDTDATSPAPVNPPAAQDWFFTFGHGHRGHAVYEGHLERAVADAVNGGNGFRLDDRYVIIHGTYEAAKARMFEVFGDVWAFQYPTADDAGVGEYHLIQLVITDDWQPGGGS